MVTPDWVLALANLTGGFLGVALLVAASVELLRGRRPARAWPGTVAMVSTLGLVVTNPLALAARVDHYGWDALAAVTALAHVLLVGLLAAVISEATRRRGDDRGQRPMTVHTDNEPNPEQERPR